MGIIKNIRSRFKTLSDKRKAKKYLKKKTYHEKSLKPYGHEKKAGVTGGSLSSNYGFSSGAKWAYGLSTTNQDFYLDHYNTRAGVRRSMQDVPMARALAQRLGSSSVGSGLKVLSMPKVSILGITPEEGESWGADVSQRYDLWANDKKGHRSEQMNFNQAQGLYGFWGFRDGDMFTRLYYSSRKDLISPLQFGFLDPNQIGCSGMTSSANQYLYENSNRDGIKKNNDGTEKTYTVLTKDKNGQIKETEIPRIGSKSGRIFMLHGFKQEYAGQSRGYSPLAHTLQEFENAQDFATSIIKKAINQSNLVLSVENQQQDAGDAGLEGLTIGRGFTATKAPEKEETEITDNGCRFELKPANEALFDTPGSVAITEMKQGDILKMLENKTPGESFKDFITPFFSFISASLNVPLEIVLMQFNKSYSASRAAIVLFHRVVMEWREEIKSDFIKPVYTMWLNEEIAAGRISAPGWQDPILKAAWLNFMLVGSPLPSIDPLKESKANMLNIEMGAENQESVARAYNGSSAIDNLSINKRLFEETPVPPWKPGAVKQEEIQEDE